MVTMEAVTRHICSFMAVRYRTFALPSDQPLLVLYRHPLHGMSTCGGGWAAGAELLAVFWFQCFAFPFCCLLLGALCFEFCMFVVGWRHAFRSEWPFVMLVYPAYSILVSGFNQMSIYECKYICFCATLLCIDVISSTASPV